MDTTQLHRGSDGRGGGRGLRRISYFFKPEVRERKHFPWLFDAPKLSHYLSPELTAVVNPREDERARYSQLIISVPRLPGEHAGNNRMRKLFFLGLSGPLAVILDARSA